MDAHAMADDQVLAKLKNDYPGHHIWRSVRRDGMFGDWVATLHDPRAGISPTLICNYPGELRDALAEERERAARKYERDSDD